MKQMSSSRRNRIGLMLAIVLLVAGIAPVAAFGADSISISHTAGFDAVQGDSLVFITVDATVLSGTGDYKLTLTAGDSDITVTSGDSGV